MGDFAAVMSAAWNAFGLELNIYGFTFTFKSAFIFVIIASIVIGAIVRIFNS